jgi:hypothetical protein
MPICKNCQKEFPNKITKEDKIYNLSGRKFCIECSPLGKRNTRTYVISLQENEAFCSRCSKIKEKSAFYLRKNNQPFSYCIECQKIIKDIKLQEKLEILIEGRGGICADCNCSFPIPVFEFYYENSVYQLSKIKNMSIIKIQQGLKNHIMLCLNCSAIRKWQELK